MPVTRACRACGTAAAVSQYTVQSVSNERSQAKPLRGAEHGNVIELPVGSKVYADDLLPGEIARLVVESFRQRAKARDEFVRLTTREEEVLVMLSKGYSNKEIADKIDLSVDTVRSHLKHIYEKMHVRSRAEAVARYMTSKLPAAGASAETK